MNTKRPWLIVAGVALVIQAAFILDSHPHLVFQVPVIDAATYHNMASALARGEAVSQDAFWQPPLYPYFLATLYRIAGPSVLAARIVQALLGVAAALIVFAIAKRMMPTRPSLIAAILFAAYGPLLFFYSQLLPTGLAVTLFLLATLLTLVLVGQPTLPRALACGAAFGIAALTVPNVLICAFIPPYYLLRNDPTGMDRSQRAKLCIVFLLALVVSIAPVTIRNASRSGAWVPISTNGGINLYIGNNPDIDTTMTIRPGLDWSRLTALPFREGARSSVEAQQIFFRKVREHALGSPGEFLGDLLKKTLLLAQSREIPRNTSLYSFSRESSILSLLTWKIGSFAFPFGLVGPLALAGYLVATRGHPERRLLAAFVLVYLATVVLFFPAARYRAPAIPGMLILAVLGTQAIIGHVRKRSPAGWEGLAMFVFGLLLMNLPVRLPGDGARHDAELKLYVGVGLQVRDRPEEALAHYDYVIAMDPAYADAYYYRGKVNLELGRKIRAVTDLGEAIRLRPDHEVAIHDLAVIHFETGQVDTSVKLLRRALRINPIYRRAMHNLGIGLMQQGNQEEGASWMHKATTQPAPERY